MVGKTNAGSALKKKTGSFVIGALTPSTVQYCTVVFDKPFASIPDVAMKASYPIAAWTPYSITTTGFVVMVQNVWDQTSYATTISWLAVGE